MDRNIFNGRGLRLGVTIIIKKVFPAFVCVCMIKGRAVVPEGHVSLASTTCEHEECCVLALPAQRHQKYLWMESGQGIAMGRCVSSVNYYFVPSVFRFADSLLTLATCRYALRLLQNARSS